jgi:xanthine dehydrogenase accessory factor
MSIWQKAQGLKDSSENFVQVTLTNVRGGAPQDIGAKCLVTKEGLAYGTIGGGKVEMKAIAHAQDLLNDSHSQKLETLIWNLQKDVGMTCGGEVTFLFEVFKSDSWKIAIFGAGHVSQALVRALMKLNCQLTVIDSRKEWIDKLPHDCGSIIHNSHPEAIVKSLSEDHYFISMTQGHAFDRPVLEEIFKNFPSAKYVGVIGSKQKAKVLKSELKDNGVSEEFLSALRVPIGLPLGKNNPEEISISIAAELLKARDES